MFQYSAVDAGLLELLRKLLLIPELKDTRLVRGTALALQSGHRKSVDSDLFGQIEPFVLGKPISWERVKLRIKKSLKEFNFSL